ncbi:MAG: hypothetical protein ACI8Z5_002063 [Lentimonas sp.]|jgi:hypothetical protein
MHAHLTSYLQDNRDQIIENWLLEAEIPAMRTDQVSSRAGATGMPIEFLSHAFERTLKVIESGKAPKNKTDGMHLDDILGTTCTCKQRTMGGRVCMELHDSGLVAFLSVFDTNWDPTHEFSEFDREHFADLINHALSGVVSNEIEHCHYKNFRSDCPFVERHPSSRA